MPSLLPGMNPSLEPADVWRDLHQSCTLLLRQLLRLGGQTFGRASPVCIAFYAVVHGVGGIRHLLCEPGWTSELIKALTDSSRRHEEGVEIRERMVSLCL